MRRLASGVSVVALKSDDERFAMTASSVTSLSDDPASLIVCVNHEASLAPYLNAGQVFSVNVLAFDQQEISMLCAQKSLGDQRFRVGDWVEAHGAPYLQSAESTFFCEVDPASTTFGTHAIVVGRVLGVLVSSRPCEPLIYHDGAYRALAV